MHAYVINMDGAQRRWDFVEEQLEPTRIPFERVSGVAGRLLELPHPDFDERKYCRSHGKRTNPGEIGCYLSHMRCLARFLDSHHEYAIICEDDIRPLPNLAELLRESIRFGEHWDILRLSGFHYPHPSPVAPLLEGYHLVINRTRLCGSGAYMVHRGAAKIMLRKMLPMFLPYDHALDREWAYGLKAATIWPLPVSQEDHPFATQIQAATDYKLPALLRYRTVFPYRCRNELQRFFARRYQRNAARRTIPSTSGALERKVVPLEVAPPALAKAQGLDRK
jgi:glycosyl transferase family 25